MPWDHRIRRRLKLRDLDTLLAVVESGSMAKAATRLSISQPAVSKAIADMEHTLGVRLLDRNALGVELNLYGRAVVKWAATVFDDVRQGVNEIEFLADHTAGELHVGTIEPVSAGLLPTILGRLRSQYPRIVFSVTTMSVLAQHRELHERKVDLVLGRVVEPLHDDLNVEILFEDQLFIVAGMQNRWSRRRKLELRELLDEPWILPPADHLVGRLIADAFRAEGLKSPQAAVTTISIQLLVHLLATGPYLAMLPSSMMQFSSKRLGLKALPSTFSASHGPIAIITLRNRTIAPVAQLFIECAREVAKPLANKR